MRQGFSTKRRWTALLLGALLLGLLGHPGAQAERVIKNLDEPLEVQLQTPLNPVAGHPFEAALTESYNYYGQVLPAGTLFRGEVEKVQQPHRLKRSGYLMLGIDEAVFPAGERVVFDEAWNQSEEKLKARRPRNPDFLRYQVPISAVSLGVTIPLSVATDMPFYVTAPIALGARMATGTALEFVYDDHDTVGKKIAWGIYRGTGIPTIVSFTRKGPSAPAYAPGQNIVLELPPQGMAQLFEATLEDDLPRAPQTTTR